jgi:hypothetical protein
MDGFTEQRRFWCRVRQGENGSWVWIGGTRDNGYGTFAVKTKQGRWTQTTSHRFAYQDQVGIIPEGFEVDHLCLVRNCVRDDHLEAVTVQENRLRRDRKARFNVPTNLKPLPIIPVKPIQPPKPDRTKFCKNGHEYAIVGRRVNGFRRDTGKRMYTCNECRKIDMAKKSKHNAAGDRTHCPQGHPYSGENLINKIKMKNGRPYNSRQCRICVRERNRIKSRARTLRFQIK